MKNDPNATTELSDGDLDLVVGGIGPSGKKTLATIKHQPLDAAAALGSGDALGEWIAASYDAGFSMKNAELLAANFD